MQHFLKLRGLKKNNKTDAENLFTYPKCIISGGCFKNKTKQNPHTYAWFSSTAQNISKYSFLSGCIGALRSLPVPLPSLKNRFLLALE